MSIQRFKIDDTVLILPKFAHLYSGDSGVVISVVPDPFRQMFNEYTVQLPDGSTATLFEFQMLENNLGVRTLFAIVVFDNQREMQALHTRGATTARQIIVRVEAFDVDMAIQQGTSGVSILGQVLERNTTHLVKRAEIGLMKDSMALISTTSDNTGVFEFDNIPRGPTNIIVVLPQHSIRILGAFLL